MSEEIVFNELYEEVDDVTPINNEYTAKINEPLDERDKAYTKLVEAYQKYYTKKSEANLGLRPLFMKLSFILLFVLVGACISVGVVGFFILDDALAVLVSIVSSIASITTSVLVLPKIIAEYLFPKNEDKYLKEIIKIFKDSDDSRWLNNKAEQKKDGC